METGEVSFKTQRGRHTTRHSEIFEIFDESYILDTPGFSSLDIERCEKIMKDSDRDYWMTSAEAKEYGMIDKVLIKEK